jgi:hypothetical protein
MAVPGHEPVIAEAGITRPVGEQPDEPKLARRGVEERAATGRAQHQNPTVRQHLDRLRVEVPAEAEPLPTAMPKSRVGSPAASETREKDLRVSVKLISGCRNEQLAVRLAHRPQRARVRRV